MRIAYFSPLNPKKSGISDYSEELLPFLNQYMDIDIFVDDFIPSSKAIIDNFNIYNISEFKRLYSSIKYDEILYHIGNNTMYHEAIYETALEYPGIVVLHDYAIHHLVAQRTVGRNDWQAYIEEMCYNYGDVGKKLAIESSQGSRRVLWETGETLKYPANLRLLNHSKGIIVHSKYIKDLILSIKPELPVQYVPLHASEVEFISENEKNNLRSRFEIPKDYFVFASYGFVSSAKRIDSILRALKRLSTVNNKFMYLIVGQEEETYKMSKYIKELDMERNARFIGFVDLDTFKDYIRVCDVCINLRYPTQGETSASLIRILGMGKPALVTNIGTFTEIPDEFCLKVNLGENEESEIYNHVLWLINNRNESIEMGKLAYNYVRVNHTLEGSADKYFQFVKAINTGKTSLNNIYLYSDSINNVADKLYEFGIDNRDEEIIKFISNKISTAF